MTTGMDGTMARGGGGGGGGGHGGGGGGGGHGGGGAVHGGGIARAGGAGVHAPAHPSPGHHPPHPPHGHGRRGRRLFFNGSWWDWGPYGWIVVSEPVTCSQWEYVDASPDLLAYASSVLADSGGSPVSERGPDGWLYLFTNDVNRTTGRAPTVWRCWPNQGGAIGTNPGAPPVLQPAPTPQAPPATPVVERPHPRGMNGVRLGANEVASRIGRDARSPRVIAWARRIVQAANLPAPRGYPDPDQIVGALFARWKRDVAFVKDPMNTELMMGTEQLLCLDPQGYCIPAGDCDDQIIGLGAAILSLGIPVWVRVRRYKGQAQAHITLLYDSAPRLGGPVKCLDPSIDSGICSDAAYLEQFVIEVDMGQNNDDGGTFLGIGQPHGGGTLGDPPPTSAPPAPATLPDAQASAWIAQITNTKAQLDASAASLRTMATQFAKVRADLGLPVTDPSAGEGAVSPLAQYISTHAWTPEAATSESKLLQTATFLSSVLADGLAGKRPMYFLTAGQLGGIPHNDIGFGSLPGDAYGLLMLPDGSGNVVPTYVDPASDSPTGTLGILPIILGLAIVGGIVLTVATAYAVVKIMDYMSAAHHDDMLQKVADQQAQLVQGGQQSPAQAQGFMQAMSDFAATSAPPAAESWISKLATPAVAAVVGVLAGFLVSRFLPAGRSS